MKRILIIIVIVFIFIFAKHFSHAQYFDEIRFNRAKIGSEICADILKAFLQPEIRLIKQKDIIDKTTSSLGIRDLIMEFLEKGLSNGIITSSEDIIFPEYRVFYFLPYEIAFVGYSELNSLINEVNLFLARWYTKQLPRLPASSLLEAGSINWPKVMIECFTLLSKIFRLNFSTYEIKSK
ncbi:MAG: hypothetical protein NZ866_02515, partial [Patescibacteria group bacterium]|nr:hypothetical protein [Patescibacteria group bacterium]